MDKVLILGGYGNFGRRIATSLVKDGIEVIIAGRNAVKAKQFANRLGMQAVVLDSGNDLTVELASLKPRIVINTCGPFQNASYNLAENCINSGINYIDLADGRDFVRNITCLDAAAKAKNIAVISGASTVPGLSSAVLESFKDEFSSMEHLTYGITPGQKTPRGLATAKSILTYLGKLMQPAAGGVRRYGWQDTYIQTCPGLGRRWMGNCDVPDLDLLPEKYGLKSIHFSAGMENASLHLSMWAMSWLVRLGLPLKLENHAAFLLAISHIFDRFGSADGGMHMIIKGIGKEGKPLQKNWFIIAKNGHGPQIPCVPAIILAKKILAGKLNITGAIPCIGLITLAEYMQELAGLDIRQFTV